MYGLRYRGALDATTQAELEGLVATLQEFLLREHNEDGTHRPPERGLDYVPIGFMGPWPTNTPPTGWLLCDGRAVSRTAYRKLFSVLGITYGAGDGVQTFNLPDMRGRFFLGKAASGTGSTLGATGGALDHTHSGPSHTHSISDDGDHEHSVSGTTNFEDNGISRLEGTGSAFQAAARDHTHPFSATSSEDGEHDHGGATGSSGTGNTGSANPPYLVGNYIILSGV
jgi:microcystin-dependent protein